MNDLIRTALDLPAEGWYDRRDVARALLVIVGQAGLLFLVIAVLSVYVLALGPAR